MSNHPITQQPQSTNSVFILMPDEYIRFEYNYKPGCCCFSSKTTTVTNMRLFTRVTKTPTIFSKQTPTEEENGKTIFLKDIDNVKQIQSAIPSSQNKWWMKCIDILTCKCSNQQIDWLESCRGVDNLAMDTTESTVKANDVQKTIVVEKF